MFPRVSLFSKFALNAGSNFGSILDVSFTPISYILSV